MEARHGRMLARLGELSLGLAEQVQAQALAAETADEQARLAHAFARVAYAMRQCLGLEAKLARDAERAQALAAGRAQAQRAAEQAQRAGQIRQTLGRAVAARFSGAKREKRLWELDRLVTEGLLFERFADAPLDAQIALLCDHLGFAPDAVAGLSPFLDAGDGADADDPGADAPDDDAPDQGPLDREAAFAADLAYDAADPPPWRLASLPP